MELITLTCDYCGSLFDRRKSLLKSSRSGKYFCNRLCKESALKERKFPEIVPRHYRDSSILICFTCGKEFKSKTNAQKFCSNECRYQSRVKYDRDTVDLAAYRKEWYTKACADNDRDLSAKKCKDCGVPYSKETWYRPTYSYCKGCCKSREKDLNKEDSERMRRKLLKSYGLTIEQYNQILIEQNNCCMICGNELVLLKLTHVDHNHKTGIVRGILCNNCNSGLGHFRDNEDYLINAAYYLSHNRETMPQEE